MSEEEAMLKAIEAQPEEDTVRGALADWLDENGRPGEAKMWRRRPVKEISLEDLPNDYDWKEVFGEGTGGNTDKALDRCPPMSDVSIDSVPMLSDVVEVIAAVNGENEGPDWVGVFRLRDGRILLANGGCDYTGWD